MHTTGCTFYAIAFLSTLSVLDTSTSYSMNMLLVSVSVAYPRTHSTMTLSRNIPSPDVIFLVPFSLSSSYPCSLHRPCGPDRSEGESPVDDNSDVLRLKLTIRLVQYRRQAHTVVYIACV